MAMPSGYKPSPLGYGSPRSSPFRRPESPVSPSPLRQTTPPTWSLKTGTSTTGSPRLGSGTATLPGDTWTPRGSIDTPRSPSTPKTAVPAISYGTSQSQLQPAQVRMLREGFQLLDRDSDGIVNREDVADMLNQLGLDSSASHVAQFFPPSSPQTVTLAVFLNTISSSLAALSDSAELVSAFSAFDDDDSGQIEVAELREALLHTAPEPGEPALSEADVDKVLAGFTGRRAFGKSRAGGGLSKKGDVFKYHDFVNSIAGGGHGVAEQGSAEDEEA